MELPKTFREKFLTTAVAGAIGSGTLVAPVAAEAQTVLPEVRVVEEPPPTYKTESLSSPKQTLPLVDTPQTVTVIPPQILEEQGVNTLRDALRNVTGISLQAGEGNPPSGDQLKIRGFSARDNILVDGARDVGIYFRDPFNTERIEVFKGPAAAFAGRGSFGGTVNLVSKTPQLRTIRDAEISLGTDDLKRLTADINQPLEGLNGAALRLNVMAHDADVPGRDQAQNERWGVAPSIAFGLGTPTRVTLSYFYTKQDNVPDSGLPNARNFSLAGSGFEGKVAPVSFTNFYGHTTDYQDLEAQQATLLLEHDFSERATLRNQLRYGRVANDSIFSSPRFVGNPTTLNAATQAVGNQKPRDQVSDILINQTDLTLRFDTGGVGHTLVTGVELSRETNGNNRRLDANGPPTSLFAPVPRAAAPIPFNGTRAELDLDTFAVYAFDTIQFTPQWLVNAGLRWDNVDTTVRAINDGRVPTYTQNLTRTDKEWSGSLGLIYKPRPNGSIYGGIGSGFDPSGRADIVQLAGGNNNLPVQPASFFVDPERSVSYELGTKWNVLDEKLLLAAALFRTEVTDGRTPGANPGDPPVVLDGEQRVDGFELSASGRVTPRLNLFAGYTYMDGEVTKSNNPFEVGQRLDNTPEHSFSGWVTYLLTPQLTVGGGVQYVSKRTSNIRTGPTQNFVITADDYTVVDLVAAYQVNRNLTFRLNVYNVTDEEYLFEFQSGQSIPGPARSAVLSAVVSF